jgi:hypothetical protein
MLPLVWNDFLWHSGLAGSIPSMVSYVLSSYIIFKSIHLITGDDLSSFMGAFVFMSNPNILYMQATPMTELILIVTFVLTVYFLIRWVQVGKYELMAAAAGCALLASLTRYEGWSLAGVGLIGVIFVCIRKKYQLSKTLSYILVYGVFAFYGILLWFLWCGLIHGDFMYFAYSRFSAYAQAMEFLKIGKLPAYRNVYNSVVYYIVTVYNNVGIILFGLFWMGFSSYLLKHRIKTKYLPPYLYLLPFAFYPLSLFKGDGVIYVPQLFPFDYFNLRFGLMAIPAISFYISHLCRKKGVLKIVIFSLLILQVVVLVSTDSIMCLNEGLKIIQDRKREGIDGSAMYLKRSYDRGLILTEVFKGEPLIFLSGLDYKNLIHEGTQNYWWESLADPGKYADWVVILKGTYLEEKLNNSALKEDFQLVWQEGIVSIYKKQAELPKDTRISREIFKNREQYVP